MLEHGKYQILLTEDEVTTLKRSKTRYVWCLALICFVAVLVFSGVFFGGLTSFVVFVAIIMVWTFVLVRFRDFYEMNRSSSFIELDGDGYAAVSELVTSMPDWQPVFVRALEQGIKLRHRDYAFLNAQFCQLKEEKQKAVAMYRILDLKPSNEYVESENGNSGPSSRASDGA